MYMRLMNPSLSTSTTSSAQTKGSLHFCANSLLVFFWRRGTSAQTFHDAANSQSSALLMLLYMSIYGA